MEALAFWVGLILYAVATVGITAGFAFAKQSWTNASFWVATAGFAAETIAIVTRIIDSGRLPYIGQFENALAGTWVIAGCYVALAIWRPSLRAAGVVVLPFVILTLGYGLTQPTVAGPVTPPYKSIWLVVHVLFAWFTYAAYTSAAALATIELIKTKNNPPRETSPIWKTPDVDTLQDLTLRLVGFGFIVNAAMIASGAIWAYELWGAYWRWDPVETWSLITWLAYALYLHLRLTLGWRGKRLAWVAVASLFGVMMAFWGVQLLPNATFHLFQDIGGEFDGGGRMGQ